MDTQAIENETRNGEFRSEPVSEHEHTIPTPEEIAAQVQMAEKLLAVRRDGGAAYDAYKIVDGIAFRPYGSPPETPYKWRRDGDFFRDCKIFEYGKPKAALDLITRQAGSVRNLAKIAVTFWRASGKKTRERFSLAIGQEMTDFVKSLAGETR